MGGGRGKGVRYGILHTWYWLLCHKFSVLLIVTFICRKSAGIFGMNLGSTTVVCCFWQVLPIGRPIKAGGKNEHENILKITSQSKIWESISSVSILKWEKSSGCRWIIFRRWRIEVCCTAPWFFNLWINSHVLGRKSVNSRVDLAMPRNSPTIAE